MGKISKLPAASSVNDADIGVIVQTGVTKRVLMSVLKAFMGIPTVPTPEAENDFQVATGSPLAWAKKTLAEAKAILGITKPTLMIMLLDKDVAIATGDNIGNIQIPVPASMVGLNLSTDSRMMISPLGTASTSGVVSFNVVRHRPSSSPVAVDATLSSPAFSIAQDAKTSGSPSIDTDNDDLASGDFLSISCEAAGTGAKGPLWAMIVAE